MKTVMREKQWAEKYPGLGTEPVPTEPYVSDKHYELERDLIFRRCWINVGRVDEVPNVPATTSYATSPSARPRC